MSKATVSPSVGRIVMYVFGEFGLVTNNGTNMAPAIVVRTWEHISYQNDEINLKVFNDGLQNFWATSVPYSETKEPGTWHWPERK